MRVPRKKKKHYKKIWGYRLGYEIKIQRSSISKDDGIWSCIVYPKNEDKSDSSI